MGVKILLADDSPHAQRDGSRILAELGYDVATVSNGSAALKRFAEDPPDLLIADTSMPGLTGLEICQRVKDNARWSATPVLLALAAFELYDAEQGRQAGADGVIQKPFIPSALEKAVGELLTKAGKELPLLPRGFETIPGSEAVPASSEPVPVVPTASEVSAPTVAPAPDPPEPPEPSEPARPRWQIEELQIGPPNVVVASATSFESSEAPAIGSWVQPLPPEAPAAPPEPPPSAPDAAAWRDHEQSGPPLPAVEAGTQPRPKGAASEAGAAPPPWSAAASSEPPDSASPARDEPAVAEAVAATLPSDPPAWHWPSSSWSDVETVAAAPPPVAATIFAATAPATSPSAPVRLEPAGDDLLLDALREAIVDPPAAPAPARVELAAALAAIDEVLSQYLAPMLADEVKDHIVRRLEALS